MLNAKQRLKSLKDEVENENQQELETEKSAMARATMEAERETALSQRESQTFAGVLAEDYFTKHDFDSLDEFYQDSWNRLSTQGKTEMGPRREARYNQSHDDPQRIRHLLASIGPRCEARNNRAKSMDKASYDQLQWGRAVRRGITNEERIGLSFRSEASMRPRCEARNNNFFFLAVLDGGLASMRPRCEARNNRWCPKSQASSAWLASMGPRCEARNNAFTMPARPFFPILLQWGRAVRRGITRHARRHHPRQLPRFNGAAL